MLTGKGHHAQSNSVSDEDVQRDALSRDALTSVSAQTPLHGDVVSVSGVVHRLLVDVRSGLRRDRQRDPQTEASDHARVDQETRDLRIEDVQIAVVNDHSIVVRHHLARSPSVLVQLSDQLGATGTTPEVDRVNARSVADRVRAETDRTAQVVHSVVNVISTAMPITCTELSHHRTSSIAPILRDVVVIVADRHELAVLDGRTAEASSAVPIGRK
jgi:hypothetical protein